MRRDHGGGVPAPPGTPSAESWEGAARPDALPATPAAGLDEHDWSREDVRFSNSPKERTKTGWRCSRCGALLVRSSCPDPGTGVRPRVSSVLLSCREMRVWRVLGA